MKLRIFLLTHVVVGVVGTVVVDVVVGTVVVVVEFGLQR